MANSPKANPRDGAKQPAPSSSGARRNRSEGSRGPSGRSSVAERKMAKGAAARKQAEQQRRRRTILYTALTLAVIGGLVAFVVISKRADEAPTADEFRQTQAALASARQAAGCTEIQSFPDAGAKHVAAGTPPTNWNSNPPTSGDHTANWLQPGFYPNEGDEMPLLHSLEHGYVGIQYKGIPAAQVNQLKALQGDYQGRKLVVMPYSGLERNGVALSAWRHNQVCSSLNLDVVKGFIDGYMLPGGKQSAAPEPMAG
jgi:hypothetical protein